MSDEKLEAKVAALETKSEYHEKEILRLDRMSQRLDSTLRAIQMQLNQIKWIGVGVGFTLVCESIGLMELIKKIM